MFFSTLGRGASTSRPHFWHLILKSIPNPHIHGNSSLPRTPGPLPGVP